MSFHTNYTSLASNFDSYSHELIAMVFLSFVITLGFSSAALVHIIDSFEVLGENDNEMNQVVYSNHPLLKRTLDIFLNQNSLIGYFDNDYKFVELTGLELDRGVLYCSYKDTQVPVSNVIAAENKIRRPRWLNYVYVMQIINYETRHILIKDYVAIKYNVTFP